MVKNLEQIIENSFEKRAEINLQTKGEVRDAVNDTMALLDAGKIRICENIGESWQVNQWMNSRQQPTTTPGEQKFLVH